MLKFRESAQGNYVVNRLKGLGELSVSETEETLVSTENRILHQVTVNDAEAATKLFSDLMGEAIIPRKVYIQEHSSESTYGV